MWWSLPTCPGSAARGSTSVRRIVGVRYACTLVRTKKLIHTPIPIYVPPGLSYFRLSRRHGLLPGLARVAKALLGLSNVCSTPDNAAYDMTVHAALRINMARLCVYVYV